jgi:hypothetical protein
MVFILRSMNYEHHMIKVPEVMVEMSRVSIVQVL